MTMPTYQSLDELLLKKGRNATSRKLANNTYVERRDDSVIAVRLHATDVVTYFSDGRVRLDTGGWRTVTTKDRISAFGPKGLSISSVKGEWRVYPRGYNGPSFPYADGFSLQQSEGGLFFDPIAGTYPDESQLEQQRIAAKKLDKDIKDYCAKLKGALDHWKLQLESTGSLNTSGDCWYCIGIVTTPDGKPASGVDHIWSHLRDGYVFPSLVVSAYAAKGYRDPRSIFARHLVWQDGDYILKLVKAFLKKVLTNAQEPVTDTAKLERYVAAAVEVLEKPGDFGYFGGDEALWNTSAPTWTKHRDSDNTDIANFEVVWNTLTAEFPELVWSECHYCGVPVHPRGSDVVAADDTVMCSGEWDGQAHALGDPLLDDEHYPPRDFNGGPALYVFGAGHWAVGHIDQIVVPVKLDGSRPVDVDNLHPAFVRLMELQEQVKSYPVLEGAEDIVERLEDEDSLRECRQYLADDATDEQVRQLRDHLAHEHGGFPDYLESETWLTTVDVLQLTPATWLERYRTIDAG